jgi:competence protein ComEA
MDMELKQKLARILLVSALATVAVPGWCAKEPSAQTPKIVNVNTADASTLATALKGIGESKAQAIVEYRKAHGPFKSAEQLAEVKGIGDKWVAANRDRISVK